jgi:hypothetical protein
LFFHIRLAGAQLTQQLLVETRAKWEVRLAQALADHCVEHDIQTLIGPGQFFQDLRREDQELAILFGDNVRRALHACQCRDFAEEIAFL